MADLDTYASPQSHSKHLRYRRLGRVRHSKQLEQFLSVQAARLSTTTAEIFALLDSYTADQIAGASSVAALQAETDNSH